MKRLKKGLSFRIYQVMILLFAALLISGCGPPQEEEPEVAPEVQDEFLEWARPLYKEIERSDENWKFLSRTLVLYLEDTEDQEALYEEIEESIALHQELIDNVSAPTDNDEKLRLSQLSEELFEARLKAGQDMKERLDSGETLNLQNELFMEIRESTKELATTFEEIMREYDLVWAHIRYFH